MIWQSIIEGFKLLGFWQIWLCMLIYLAVNFFLPGLFFTEKESSRKITGGLFYTLFGKTIIQIVLISSMLIYLMPILLGKTFTTPLNEVYYYFLPAILAGFITVCVVVFLSLFASFVPILGKFISSNSTFLIGLMLFTFIAPYSTIDTSSTDTFPGLWIIIIYLLILVIFTVSLTMLVSSVQKFSATNLIIENLLPYENIYKIKLRRKG